MTKCNFCKKQVGKSYHLYLNDIYHFKCLNKWKRCKGCGRDFSDDKERSKKDKFYHPSCLTIAKNRMRTYNAGTWSKK